MSGCIKGSWAGQSGAMIERWKRKVRLLKPRDRWPERRKNNRRHVYTEVCAIESMTYGIFCTSSFCICGIMMDGWMNTIWRTQEGWIWSLWLLLTHSQMPLHQSPSWCAECCSLFLCRCHPWREKGRSDWKKEIMKGVNNLEIYSLLVLSLSDMKKRCTHTSAFYHSDLPWYFLIEALLIFLAFHDYWIVFFPICMFCLNHQFNEYILILKFVNNKHYNNEQYFYSIY